MDFHLPQQKVRLHFSATDIFNRDLLSKSDPYVVLYHEGPNGNLSEAGRTETLKDQLNPRWTKPIEIIFAFEQEQKLCAIVYDYDGSKSDKFNDKCGEAHFFLSNVIASKGGKNTFPLDKKGQLHIASVNVSQARRRIQLQFRGVNLMQRNFFGQTDGYYRLYANNPNGTFMLLEESEVVVRSLDPLWRPGRMIELHTLGPNPVFRFECWAKRFCRDVSNGGFTFTMEELDAYFNAQKGFQLRKAHKPQNLYGEVIIHKMIDQTLPNFIDLLTSGWKINLAVSIDFTASNLPAENPSSLHAARPGRLNNYANAIVNVCSILKNYAESDTFAAFGFGAKYNGIYSDFFNLNQKDTPYVKGVEGILHAYHSIIPKLRFWGPTNFAPTIRNVTVASRSFEASRCYTILLILTDGAITDMDATIDAIVDADDAPLSIIIVGLGNADFSAMKQLDSDEQPLQHTCNRFSRRDLVQFVPYSSFASGEAMPLSIEVLKEVPSQFEEYAMLSGIALQERESILFPL